MKPRIKVLVAVWGSSYIDAFMRLALPSLLAPGNLPALAEASELDVCILTSEQDFPLIEAKSAFKALRALCRVEFVGIDDLLGSSVYGITLTLAYMRGISTEGENMVNVHFMFFNSDFILAEGSLKSLLGHILAGRRAIMAPSFRAIAEDMEPLLAARVDGSRHTLAVAPREMVALALRHMHATIVAKTVNQSIFRSLYQNQLYWRVDKDTVLGRFYLMFMLCIRPERVVRQANTYCDYGFVPEFCPSGDVAYLTDSDEFFMLETQARNHELPHIRLGAHSITDIAGYLSEWTTRGHRAAAAKTLIFHAADLLSSIADESNAAQRYMDRIAKLLPPPIVHAYSTYWMNSVPVWQKEVQHAGKSGKPPELHLAESMSARSAARARILRRLRQWIIGTRPDVRPWHADWVEYRLIKQAVHVLASARQCLAIIDDQSPINALLYRLPGTLRSVPRDRAMDPSQPPVSGLFDGIFLVVRPGQIAEAGARLVPDLMRALREQGQLTVIVHDPGVEFLTENVLGSLIELVRRASECRRIQSATVQVSSATLQRHTRSALRRLGHFYFRQGPKSVPVVAPMAAVLLLANMAANFLAVTWPRPAHQPDYCSAVIVKVAAP